MTTSQKSSEIIEDFMESQNGLGWKGPYSSHHSKPPAVGRDPFHQPRVLKAPSSLALNPAREGAATASQLKVLSSQLKVLSCTFNWVEMTKVDRLTSGKFFTFQREVMYFGKHVLNFTYS